MEVNGCGGVWLSRKKVGERPKLRKSWMDGRRPAEEDSPEVPRTWEQRWGGKVKGRLKRQEVRRARAG